MLIGERQQLIASGGKVSLVQQGGYVVILRHDIPRFKNATNIIHLFLHLHNPRTRFRWQVVDE